MQRMLILALLILASGSAAPAHDDEEGSFGVFYTALDPHGEWILVDRGLYAWRPAGVMAGWRPYTVGRWMWTRYGWYWVSAEPWGWATYHYGRWYYDEFHGWVWLPGREWAPAWVEWRTGGDVIGWAPLPPYAHFSITIGISFSTRWVTPYDWWTFVDCRHMTAPSVHRYAYRTRYNERYVGRTRSVGSVRYHEGAIRSGGPERIDVERRGRVRVPDADIVESRGPGERVERAGGGRRVEVYRPSLEDRTGGEAVRPGRVREGRVSLETDAVRPGRGRPEGREFRRDEASPEYRERSRQESAPPDRTREPRIERPSRRDDPALRRDRPGRSVDRTPKPDARPEVRERSREHRNRGGENRGRGGDRKDR